MPTDYPGREEHNDLGNGHSFAWLYGRGGQIIGLMEHHPKGPNATAGAKYCGGYVAWVPAEEQRTVTPWTANHRLINGGPGDERHLTLAPSLACRNCESHGFIRDGRWIDA